MPRTEHGVTLYEVETVMNGLSRDILIKLERVTAPGVTTFEAHVQQASKKRSVTVDPNGQVVAPK